MFFFLEVAMKSRKAENMTQMHVVQIFIYSTVVPRSVDSSRSLNFMEFYKHRLVFHDNLVCDYTSSPDLVLLSETFKLVVGQRYLNLVFILNPNNKYGICGRGCRTLQQMCQEEMFGKL